MHVLSPDCAAVVIVPHAKRVRMARPPVPSTSYSLSASHSSLAARWPRRHLRGGPRSERREERGGRTRPACQPPPGRRARGSETPHAPAAVRVAAASSRTRRRHDEGGDEPAVVGRRDAVEARERRELRDRRQGQRSAARLCREGQTKRTALGVRAEVDKCPGGAADRRRRERAAAPREHGATDSLGLSMACCPSAVESRARKTKRQL
jgi:hypothetical protein